jgi:stearoyl-CoA desaturase (Delta-9 desaturase)
MSDLKADPYVMFQHKHYLSIGLLVTLVFPTLVPWLVWGETLKASFFLAVTFRYVLSLHITWLINSAAHKFGMKPYDKYD